MNYELSEGEIVGGWLDVERFLLLVQVLLIFLLINQHQRKKQRPMRSFWTVIFGQVEDLPSS